MTAAPPPAAPPPGPVPSALGSPSWTPPPEAPQRPPLRRSRTDRVVGGVAGGLAEYTGVDALLWRIGFIALTVAGGSGILVYLLLLVLMPSGDRSGPGRGRAPRTPRGPRSAVPGATLALALIVAGVLVLLSRITGWGLGPRAVLGAALLVVGGGLIVSAFAGGRHARGGLITLGIALSVALSIASTGPWNRFRGGVGDHTYFPLTAAAVRSTYDAGVGNTTVDLTRVDLAGAPTPIRTRVDGGIGNLRVLLPASADVQVDLSEGMGRADVLGNGASGGFYAGSGSASWTGDGRPEFVISIDAGIGNVEVDRG